MEVDTLVSKDAIHNGDGLGIKSDLKGAAQPNGDAVKGNSTRHVTPSATARNSTPSKSSGEGIPVTNIFAKFIANVDTGILTTTIRGKLKEYLLDYIGVTAAAAHSAESTEAIYNAVLALGGATGTSTVLIKGKSFTPQYAGLLNATFGHSLDFDDTYAKGTLHAGVSAISAGLAQAELMGKAVDTDRFLLAVAIGYEVTCRIGRELGPEAYARGFHNSSTAGIFGAVATIAVLVSLSADVIENAFGLAGSKAAGSMQYLENGSWNKRLHPGFAVHDAFMCVALAEAGVIGAMKILEGRFGFLNAYSSKEDKDLVYLTADLGTRWTFLENSLKPFPACRMTHGFIEHAGFMGAQKKASTQLEVKSLTLSLSPANLSIVGIPTPNKLHPQNMVDAQFSAFFQTAHAWLYGSNSGIHCYERLHDPEIYKLSEKITCVADPQVREMGSKIRVDYEDGRSEEVDIPFPLGEPEHPFTRDRVDAKFFSLVIPVYGENRAKEIMGVVDDLEGHTVSELLEMLV